MRRLRLGAAVAWGVLACALGPSACAGPHGPVPIRPHLSPVVPSDVPADLPRIGVGRFLDARPVADRVGSQPRLRIRWYGLERRGEVQTGDASFQGSIPEGVREDAIATLARSGAFSEVRALDLEEEDARAAAARGLVDLVLTARLEEIVGLQRESRLVSFFLLGAVRGGSDDPVGLARIHYRVHDARGLLLEERIEEVHRSSVRTPAQAALDAVARCNERLADLMFVRLVPEAARVRRELPLRCVERCGLGIARVQPLLREASAILEREAGVRLRCEWTSGAREELPGLGQALAASRANAPPAGGAALWLVRVAPARGSEPFGLSVPLGEHAVVACGTDGPRAVTVAHEIAHLFGAVHVDSRSSVMHAFGEFDGRFLDPLNRRILRAAWDRPFGSPLPAPTREKLDALYRHALEHPTGVDVRQVRALLASVDASTPP